MNQIRGCTEGKGGHAAFASILWSPPATLPEVSTRGGDFITIVLPSDQNIGCSERPALRDCSLDSSTLFLE